MNNIYSVISEFHFDIAEAVADSKTLQNELQKVSTAADAVNEGLKQAAWSLLGQIGLYGGIGGAIYSAIKAADKYQQSQRSIANIFLSNKMFEGPKAFEAAMVSSAEAMENMKKVAREFSLPVADLVSSAKGIGAVLVNQGLDDSKLTRSTQMARGFLKSAPTLGIDPGLAQNQLINMVTGHASMNDTLAQRLMNETSAMKPYAQATGSGNAAGGGMGKFNALRPEIRVKALTDALMQFGSNTKIVEENARSLSSQMQRMSDNITGMFSILRPIGEAMLEPIKKIMLRLNIWLETHGEETSKKIGGMLKQMFEDPQQVYARVQQYRQLRNDFHKAGELVTLHFIIHSVTWALRLLGFELQGGLLLTGLRTVAGWLGTLAGYLFTWANALRAFAILKYVVIEALLPLAVFTSAFQGLSRGFALAFSDYVVFFAENASRIAALAIGLKEAFSKIFAPFALITEGFANIGRLLGSHVVGASIALDLLERFVGLLSFLGDVIVHIMAEFSGVITAVLGVLDQLMRGNFRHMFDDMSKDAEAGYHMIWDRFHKGATQNIDTSQTSQNKIDIHNVTIQNAFKEQMEPDRIAFAIKDQLMKAALNPLQGNGSQAARATR